MAFAILYFHYILYKTVDYRRIKYSCKIRNLQYNKLNLLFTFLSSQNTKLFDRIHILQINYFLIIFQRETLTIEYELDLHQIKGNTPQPDPMFPKICY